MSESGLFPLTFRLTFSPHHKWRFTHETSVPSIDSIYMALISKYIHVKIIHGTKIKIMYTQIQYNFLTSLRLHRITPGPKPPYLFNTWISFKTFYLPKPEGKPWAITRRKRKTIWRVGIIKETNKDKGTRVKHTNRTKTMSRAWLKKRR